jgi:uncharacterized protein involved in oxidation of intracellular sulfur
MKLGIIIETKKPEKAWNGMRFAVTGQKAGYKVKIFLMGEGVEIETLSHDKYDVAAQVKTFHENKGTILTCGTCLQSRSLEETDVCPINTMADCLKMFEWADKTVTF